MQRPIVATLVAVLAAISARTVRAQGAEDDLREGDRYFEDGDWKHAASSYDSAIRKYPGQVPPEAYGKRAAIYIIQKQLDDGLTFLRDVAEKQYRDAPEILEQEALILWAKGKKPEAIDVAEKVVAKKPATYSNQQIIGEFYAGRDAGKTVTAYEAYLGARPAELEDKDVLPRIKLGFAYLALGQAAAHDGKSKERNADYQKAVDQFETLEKKFGKKPYAMTNAENGLCAAYTAQAAFDRAITVCERIITDPKKIDSNASVWFNLGTSYLANKQPKRARTAANEYVRVRKNEPRGYVLIGDSYFEERDWTNALQYYLEAEKRLKAGPQQVEVSIKLGKTYLRLPTPDVGKAIEKLNAGMQANPNSLELGVELGDAYIANKDDGKALALSERLIGEKEFAAQPEDQRVSMLVVSGKALYNQAKLKDARARFEQAAQIRPKDVQVRRGLVEAINRQALDALAKDPKAAEQLLGEALAVDGDAPMTSVNLAVMLIERGDCDGATRYLAKLQSAKGYTLPYERLTARTFLCGKARDPKKAAEHYAKADAEARTAQANLVEAEINTEWAPLIWDTDLDGAIDKLQVAVQFSAQEPTIASAAKRNLYIALFKRGWRELKEGKAAEAAADFDHAYREPALLKGNEPLAFEFSLALATLDKGDNADAARMFGDLATKGNQDKYLKMPYAKIGAQFFKAYANYRSGNPSSRATAAADFEKIGAGASGGFAAKIKDLTASAYEMIAVDAIKSGHGGAEKALATAAKYASGDMLKRITLDRVVAANTGDVKTLEDMGGTPPEALIDLGILYDRLGRAKDAYDTWQKAKARGAGGATVQKWIDAKKRIYGF